MRPVDSSFEESSLPSVWRALTGRLAVTVGSATALLSLIVEAPVWVASVRGLVAWLGVIVIARSFGLAVPDTPAHVETDGEETARTE